MIFRALVAVWLVSVCAGCARSTAGKGEKTIRRVDIAGNRAFGDGAITGKLATRPPHGFLTRTHETFDPIALALDRERIVAFYRERGFFAARVVDVDVKPAGEGAVDVRFVVEEGRPTQVAAVRVDGLPRVDGTGKLLGPLREGERLYHPDYLAAKERIKTELIKQGYAHAEVEGTVEVNRDARRAVIRLRVDPGPLVRFGKVHVEGLERMPESAVQARVDWHEGDRFDPVEVEKTQGRLYQLGAFSVVRIDYEKEGRPAVSDVTIHVAEGARHEVRLGFGFALERVRSLVRGRAGYTVRGWFHPLITLRLDARPGWTVTTQGEEQGFVGEASAVLEKEDFLWPRLRETNTLAYDYEPYDGYTYRGPRAQIAVARPAWSERLRWHLGWTFRDLTFIDVDPAVAAQADLTPYRLGYFDQSLVYDGRDRPLDARRGWYGAIELEEGGSFAGGGFEYARITPELRGYLPIGSRLVLAARARAGRLLRETDAAPLTRRYYGGGASGHRGFSYRRLSPWVDSETRGTIPIGGAELVETSLETRIDVTRLRGSWLSLALFLDGGDVTRMDEMDLTHLHWAAGAGLRYDTVVGPLRLDFGYRLNRTGPGNPEAGRSWAFHFSLGEAF